MCVINAEIPLLVLLEVNLNVMRYDNIASLIDPLSLSLSLSLSVCVCVCVCVIKVYPHLKTSLNA